MKIRIMQDNKNDLYYWNIIAYNKTYSSNRYYSNSFKDSKIFFERIYSTPSYNNRGDNNKCIIEYDSYINFRNGIKSSYLLDGIMKYVPEILI